LSKEEFNLCKRFYELIRSYLPPPDLIIHLTASQKVILQRLAKRIRINVADPKDTFKLASFLESWLSSVSSEHLIHVDVSENDHGYRRLVASLLPKLRSNSV
jgi:deoxyadenosine/deoxycytidine kinase